MKIRVARYDSEKIAWYFDLGVQYDEGETGGPGFYVNGLDECYAELRVLVLDPYNYCWTANPISDDDRGKFDWETLQWQRGRN